MATKPLFRCYIDESGDEGFRFDRGSSPWFFLSGIIVNTIDDADVRGVIDEAVKKIWIDRNQTPPQLLHWRNLGHNKKIVVAKLLAQKPFCQIAVGICKPKIQRQTTLRCSDHLYRYMARFLLERVSWYVDEAGGWVELVFSNRNKFDKDTLETYVVQIMRTPGAQIRPVFDPAQILVRNPAQLRMLQVADCCTSAVANAFNPDHYENVHPYYLETIRCNLYRRGGKLFSYGLKLFPNRMPVEDYPFLSDL